MRYQFRITKWGNGAYDPDNFGSWAKIDVDYSGISITREKQDDEVYNRVKITGDFVATGDYYDLITQNNPASENDPEQTYGANMLYLGIFCNGDVIGVCTFNRHEKVDISFKTAKFKIIETIDYYYSLLKEGGGLNQEFLLSGCPVDALTTTNQIAINVSGTPVNYLGIAWRLTDLIKYAYGALGSAPSPVDTSVVFDSASFSILNTVEGENLSGFNKPFKNLIITPLPYFIPDNRGDPVYYPAGQYAKYTLKMLFDWLKTVGFYMKYEYNGGTKYFRLVHLQTENTNRTTQSVTLADYKGDWTQKNNNYQMQKADYVKIVHDETYGDPDFKLTIPYTIDNVLGNRDGSERTFSDTIMITDADAVYLGRFDQFDTDSREQFVILACDTSGSYYFVRKGTSRITGSGKNNTELSYTYIVEKWLSDIPVSSSTINNYVNNSHCSIAITENRMKMRKQLELPCPVFQINNDFDFSKWLNYKGDNHLITKITHKGTDNIGKITINRL
jgi:hypothetical protein